jgi:DNA replication protein DnaC
MHMITYFIRNTCHDESITAERDGSRLDSDLVILDGLGYLPFSLRRSLLFRLLSKLCERAPASFRLILA